MSLRTLWRPTSRVLMLSQKAVIPRQMRERKSGNIIFIASMTSYFGIHPGIGLCSGKIRRTGADEDDCC